MKGPLPYQLPQWAPGTQSSWDTWATVWNVHQSYPNQSKDSQCSSTNALAVAG